MWRSRLQAHIEHMSGTQNGDLSSFSNSLVALVDEVVNGVVAVKSAAHRVTSGVSLGDDMVAVASHSLRRDERVPVRTADGSEAQATILGRDPGVDLAILKVEDLATRTLPVAEPTALKAGMLAAIVGLTIDAGPTASLGILGAVGPARRNWRGGTLDQFVRLDANVYPSQSGAAVVNAQGQLIGMATPALSRHSTLAVPMSTIERIARELREQGRIRHGYLGVGVQPVALPENLRSDLPQVANTGLILLSVESGSPAEKGGLQLGDILLLMSGQTMTDIDELQAALRGNAVGQNVKAVLLRGGKPIEAELTIVERPRKS